MVSDWRYGVLESLRDCSVSGKIQTNLRDSIELISIVDHPDAYPPSDSYSQYVQKVATKISDIGSLEQARKFVMATYILSLDASVPPVVDYYPALKEFVRLYHKDPELLVVLYDYSDAVADTEEAGNWLTTAHEMDPDNRYLLWQRIVARGDPWYPPELIHAMDPFEDELWLVNRILTKNPYDPTAAGFKSRLEATRKSLSQAENTEFRNNLVQVIPHPMRQIGLPTLLDPRRLSSFQKVR